MAARAAARENEPVATATHAGCLYPHMLNGGTLTADNVADMVKTIERRQQQVRHLGGTLES